MASIRKRGQRWQAQIRRQGKNPLTRTFPTKSAASAWARQIEAEIDGGSYIDRSAADKMTLSELLELYQSEVLPMKKAQKQFKSVAKRLGSGLGRFSLANLTPRVIAEYRDQRLSEVSSQTVKHELSIVSRVFNYAIRECGVYPIHGNPIQYISMPKMPAGRNRRLNDDEESCLLAALGATKVMRQIVTFAIETAMRRGEIASMCWSNVYLSSRTIYIPETKTDTPRSVPLSTRATDVLNGLQVEKEGSVWGISPDSITQAFNRACRRSNIEDLRFHDLRHEATSRLFERGLSVMEVASITGHTDVRMLRRYTHLRACDIVQKLG